jgi:hypothetical protein
VCLPNQVTVVTDTPGGEIALPPRITRPTLGGLRDVLILVCPASGKSGGGESCSIEKRDSVLIPIEYAKCNQ